MFSEKTYELEIITPEAKVFSGQVNYTRVRTLTGDMGILAGHALLMAALQTWPVKIEMNNEEHLIAVFEGFIEVTPEKTTILATNCELPEAIDVERAERAKKRAEERLQGHAADIDMVRAEAALRRSLTRLKTVGKIPLDS